jgi:serine/threonine-protein kinase HipA
MIHLRVWLHFATHTPVGLPFPVGELIVSDPDPQRGGRLQGEFRYLPEYLDRQDAFALDPIHLPLQAHSFEAGRPHAGIHGVFEDSLPDDWGRRILSHRHQLSRAQSRPANLLALLGNQTMGALAYTPSTSGPQHPPPAPVTIPATELSALMDAARQFELAAPSAQPDQLMRLFQAASSPGGARPKVLVDDHGSGWLVKLASSQDRCDMVRIEAASLTLAQAAGLDVPEHRLVKLHGHSGLMLRRFDQTPAGGRRHLISLHTLLAAEGYYSAGYSDLADIVRRVSDQPEHDLSALYRQMLFNAVLGNTDDHLKNFAMLHDTSGWRLTPAYDLLPDVNQRREHILNFGPAGLIPTVAAMDHQARAFGISAATAASIRTQVVDAISSWRAQFAASGVPPDDIQRLDSSITHRLSQLSRP